MIFHVITVHLVISSFYGLALDMNAAEPTIVGVDGVLSGDRVPANVAWDAS